MIEDDLNKSPVSSFSLSSLSYPTLYFYGCCISTWPYHLSPPEFFLKLLWSMIRGMTMKPDKLKLVRLHFMDWVNPHFAKNWILSFGGKTKSSNLEKFFFLRYTKKNIEIFMTKFNHSLGFANSKRLSKIRLSWIFGWFSGGLHQILPKRWTLRLFVLKVKALETFQCLLLKLKKSIFFLPKGIIGY